MAIEIPQNEENSGGGKSGRGKGVGSAIRRRRAKWRSINVKKRERGRVI